MSDNTAHIPSRALFLDELRTILRREDLSDDSSFVELAPDSLQLMEVLTFLNEYAPGIEPEDVSQAMTVGGLYRFIALGAVDRGLP